MSRPRPLIAALDGAILDLVGSWSQAGYLPKLSRLMALGIHGPCKPGQI